VNFLCDDDNNNDDGRVAATPAAAPIRTASSVPVDELLLAFPSAWAGVRVRAAGLPTAVQCAHECLTATVQRAASGSKNNPPSTPLLPPLLALCTCTSTRLPPA